MICTALAEKLVERVEVLLMFLGNVGKLVFQFRVGGLLCKHLELLSKKLFFREKVVDRG